MLFEKVFEIINDQKSDEKMIENVLWFATSLCEQRIYNFNHNLIVQILKSNQIILIIWKSLCSKQERIILQALKLLAKVSEEEEFRGQLFN